MLKLRHFGWLIQMCLLIGLHLLTLKHFDLQILMLKRFGLLILTQSGSRLLMLKHFG